MSFLPAFLFPGQGAQFRGMAVDLVDAFEEAREVFDRGKEILRRDILSVCRDGPEEDLSSTRISQPATFLHSMAVLAVVGERLSATGPFGRGLSAMATAGLSLGEYSALVFAGSIQFEDALRIVALRGEFMQEACDSWPGTMASVIGLETEKVEDVVSQARSRGLEIGVANYNSPDQTVISGAVGAMDEIEAVLKAAGARRVMKLKVAGAFHSPLMASATRKLEPHLRNVSIHRPRVPFCSNVTGGPVDDPEAIREGLLRQIESPVRWKQSMAFVLDRGLTRALELGPGRVLQGLLRKLQTSAEVLCLGTRADLEKLSVEQVTAA